MPLRIGRSVIVAEAAREYSSRCEVGLRNASIPKLIFRGACVPKCNFGTRKFRDPTPLPGHTYSGPKTRADVRGLFQAPGRRRRAMAGPPPFSALEKSAATLKGIDGAVVGSNAGAVEEVAGCWEGCPRRDLRVLRGSTFVRSANGR